MLETRGRTGFGLRGVLRRGGALAATLPLVAASLSGPALGCASDEPKKGPGPLSREDQEAVRNRAGEDQMDLDQNIEREEAREEK
jgi:hypothetical protein